MKKSSQGRWVEHGKRTNDRDSFFGSRATVCKRLKLQIFVHEFRNFFVCKMSRSSCATFCKHCKVPNVVHKFGTLFFWFCEMSRTKFFPLACNFCKLSKVQIFVHRFRNFCCWLATCRARYIFPLARKTNSCLCRAPRGVVTSRKLPILVPKISRAFANFFVCKMSCTKHFRLACNFLQTLQSCTFSCTSLETFFVCEMSHTKHFSSCVQPFAKLHIFVHKFRNFFCVQDVVHETFSARVQLFANFAKLHIFVHKFGNFFCVQDVVHETFSAHVQLFANFAKFRFSCTSLETFFVCKMSCTKHFRLACKTNFCSCRAPRGVVTSCKVSNFGSEISRTFF